MTNPVDQKARAAKFPQAIIDAAVAAMHETECPASVTLAQWALESGYGAHLCAKNAPFGMKWFEGCPYPCEIRTTHEWRGDHYVSVMARFIAFPTMEEAFANHGHLLMEGKPYAQAAWIYRHTKDVAKFVQRMGPVYATKPDYADVIMQLIEQWGLLEFDQAPVPAPKVEPAPVPQSPALAT